MIDESSLLEESDQFAAKVGQADSSISLLAGWQIHAVERQQSPGLEYAQKFRGQEAEMLEEFFMSAAVTHIALAG